MFTEISRILVKHAITKLETKSFHVKWTRTGNDPSQILLKLFQVKGR